VISSAVFAPNVCNLESLSVEALYTTATDFIFLYYMYMSKTLSQRWVQLKQMFRASKESTVSTVSVETSSKEHETLSKDHETLSKHTEDESSAQCTTEQVRTPMKDGRSKQRTAKQIEAYKRNFAKKNKASTEVVRSSPVYDAMFDGK
jgi:hypothetical protein